MSGKILLVNGASSAGKSTLCRGLQAALPEPFWHFSIDHLLDAGVLPLARVRAGEFAWKDLRPGFFDGFHQCLPTLAAAGNNLIVEHIIETPAMNARLRALLAPFDVFFVGVHCPMDELERRERERGDRRLGDARRDIEVLQIHQFGPYDWEVASTQPLAVNVANVVAAWKARGSHRAFTPP